jgi:hypothetical protein
VPKNGVVASKGRNVKLSAFRIGSQALMQKRSACCLRAAGLSIFTLFVVNNYPFALNGGYTFEAYLEKDAMPETNKS